MVARQEWEHRAGWAGAYRELVGHDDDHDALGNAPGAGRVEHRMMFRAAHDALALAEAGDEEAGMTDGRLRARVAGYQRERAWAPRWVADELAATHERRDQLSADATLWEFHAAAPGATADEATKLRADAAAARAEAEQLTAQIADLDQADDAYAAWFAHTAVSRDLHDRASHELRARGVDIDNPPDRTTAPAWLNEHRAAQAEHERYAVITDADVVDDHEIDRRAGVAVGRPIETDVADIREVATPQPTERVDPVQRRRVLTLNESTEAVKAAQAALDEIAARKEAEEAARAAEETARQEQITRWSADDIDRGAAGEAADLDPILDR